MDNHLHQDAQAVSRVAQSLSNVEKEYYAVLWRAACSDGDILRGKAAFDFLNKSQLPREILKRIWDIADWQKRGLAWEEFVVTLKLISAAQKKQLVSWERVLQSSGPTSRDLPVFDGIEAPTDGEKETQKRDVFAEFEALAGVASSGPLDALPEVTHPPAAPAEELAPTGGSHPSGAPHEALPDEASKWDAFDAPVWHQAPVPGPASAPAPTSAPAHQSTWQAFGQPAIVESEATQAGDTAHVHEMEHRQPDASSGEPVSKDQTWAAFGEQEAVERVEPKPMQAEWDGFGGAAQPAQPSWDAFGDARGDGPVATTEEMSEWAAFESASVPASTTATTTASTAAPTGDLWSKMSAFDDLLKEEDTVEQGGQSEAEQTLAPAHASEGDSEFGDFAAGPSSPEAEATEGKDAEHSHFGGEQKEAKVESVNFLDFSPPVRPVESTSNVATDLPFDTSAGLLPSPSPDFAAFDEDFGDFGSAPAEAQKEAEREVAEPVAEPVNTGLDLPDLFGKPPSDVPAVLAMPPGGLPVATADASALADAWAAFPEPGSETQPSQPFQPPESWNAFDGAQGPTEVRQQADEDWASFGFDLSAPGGTAEKEAEDKPSPSPLVFDEVPKQGNTPEPFVTEEPEDGGSEAAEARALARSLCSLGRFEEALQCKANGDILRRLNVAEEKKKEAVAQDDFEGAIQIRSEIKALGHSLVSDQVLEAWRNLASGERDASLETAAEQLRQRCQWMDGFSSAALGVAVSNFRRACPEHRANCLPVLPSLVRQQRRARQMYRAIEAISSQNVLIFLQVILVCIKTLSELLAECSVQIGKLADPDWSDEERECVHESDELLSLLRGLSGLRRLLWRLGLAAELFMPEGEGPMDSPDAQTLQELQKLIASSLAKAKASWAKLESDIISLRLKIEPWQEAATFEAGGCTNGSVQQHRTAPLCRLCLLPAVPLGMEAEIDDAGAVSAPWRGGHWHVQCANFWLRHASCSRAFKDLKVEDPFEEYHCEG